VQAFVTQHRPLILKHARAFVRANAEKIAGEDVAREVELVLVQLGELRGTKPEQIESPDSYLRAIVLHAARRAKRRHTLIE
jgi:DNA-directed RNA polymerase specialized sigma24 family protein